MNVLPILLRRKATILKIIKDDHITGFKRIALKKTIYNFINRTRLLIIAWKLNKRAKNNQEAISFGIIENNEHSTKEIINYEKITNELIEKHNLLEELFHLRQIEHDKTLNDQQKLRYVEIIDICKEKNIEIPLRI